MDRLPRLTRRRITMKTGVGAASVPPVKDDAEARAARRNAPFLRVVTDNDPDFGAPNACGRSTPAHRRQVIRAARENAGYTLEQVSRKRRASTSATSAPSKR
jgi:hypothetical protein